MKALLLKKIRQRYDYYWRITPQTNWDMGSVNIRVFNKKTNEAGIHQSVTDFIRAFEANANMNIITRLIWNNIKEKHNNKIKIRDWNKQKKSLALSSNNLTIKQVIQPKNVKCFKLKEHKINLATGTSNSIMVGSSNWATSTTLNTTNNFVQTSPTPYGYTNGFVTVTHSKSGTSMLTYP
jgi:hypothetical protein